MHIKHLFSTYNSLLNAGFVLLLLTIIDAIFTDYGLRYSYIEEANPLMKFIYDTSTLNFYIVKISLPLLLLHLLTRLQPKIYLRLLIGATLLLYTIVLFHHIFWMTLIFRAY